MSHGETQEIGRPFVWVWGHDLKRLEIPGGLTPQSQMFVFHRTELL